MSLNILHIPDGHVEPGTSNRRWTALGRFILDRRPDVIVNTGDMADMPSLSHYDKGKSDFHHRRYRDDIDSVQDALRCLHEPIDEYNNHRVSMKKRQYRPRWVFCHGNHENRINRAIENDRPMLEGSISLQDLGLEQYGYEIHPFLQPTNINGVLFNHYYTSGIMGKPVGGVNSARTHTVKLMTSTVSGHSHEAHHYMNTTADGRKVHALIGGCFFEHSHAFSAASEHFYWRGFHMLNNVAQGEYDLEQVRMNTLLENYL